MSICHICGSNHFSEELVNETFEIKIRLDRSILHLCHVKLVRGVANGSALKVAHKF